MKAKKIIGPAIAAASLALAAWGGARLYRVTTAITEATIPTTAVKRGDVTFAVYARGEFQGGNSIMLTAPMAGGNDMSITFLRSAGELVKTGDIVFQFDTTDQAYKLKEAEADLAEAEQKVIQAQAQMQAKEEEDNYLLIKARSDLKQAELEARKNPVVSGIQGKQNDLAVDGARATLDQLTRDLANRKATSQAGVEIQNAVVAKAKVQIDTAKKNIDMMTVHAPRDGYVNIQANMNGNNFFQGMVLPMLQVGDTIRAGMAVAQLPDMHNWEATARIAEADRGHLALHQPVARDLRFLWSELVSRIHGSFAGTLTCRLQLEPCALGERLHSTVCEEFVSGSQLLASVQAPVLAPQPFAVEEMRARELGRKTRAAQSFDRFAVRRFSRVAVCQQRSRTDRDPQPPVCAGDGGVIREALEGTGGMFRPAAPACSLDQFGQRPA